MPHPHRHATKMLVRTTLALLLAVTTSACTTMRISGLVTDERTGEPVGMCGITSGSNYARTDPIGHYTIAVKRDWKTMQVIAPGYETQTVAFPETDTRRPIVNVKLRAKPKPAPAPKPER